MIFLSIFIESGLGWDSYIQIISSKIASGIFILRRLSRTVDNQVLLSVYYAYIACHIEHYHGA